MGPEVQIFLAGRMAITAGDGQREIRLGPLGRVALSYLVLERRRPVGRAELADALWGERLPNTWAAALRGVMARLRRAVGECGLPTETVLTTTDGRYQLHLPEAVVDLERAAGQAESAHRALAQDDAERARREVGAAIEVCRHGFLPGAEGPWAQARQAELDALHVECLELVSRAARACDDPTGALRAARQAVRLEPLRESAHREVMAAHAAAGNRGQALRAYERCRRTLADELGIDPSPSTEADYLSLLRDEPGTRATAGPHPSNLPSSTTSFVGREAQVAEVTALSSCARILTLTGTAGVGKSRLALEVAARALDDHPDGAWLVDLASLRDGHLVADRVLAALGLAHQQGRTPRQSLAAQLADRRLLVILDDCERLVAHCAELAAALVAECPGLRLMATSREPLRVAGETVWTVPALTVPDPDWAGDASSLLDHESARLFVERAAGFDLGMAAPAVAAICRRLEGIPLAIELAAGRTGTVEVDELARRLGQRLTLLGPGTGPRRHRSVSAALDGSYEALPGDERWVLRRLAVFAGGFERDAAQAVCGDGRPVAAPLERLVDGSLVAVQRAGGTTRYRLLETVRQYAAERLHVHGEDDDVRARHLRWVKALVSEATPHLEGPDQIRGLTVLDAEKENVRAALDWAGAHAPATEALDLAASLWRFWEIRGHLGEGRARLEALLDRDVAYPVPLRARALNSAGVLAQRQCDWPAARRHFDACLALRRRQGDPLGVTAALHGLGTLAACQGDMGTAATRFEESLAAGRSLGDRRATAAALLNLGAVTQLRAERQGVPESAARRCASLLEESLVLYRDLGDRHGAALALENLGSLAALGGDESLARSRFGECLALRRELGDRQGTAACLRFLGQLAWRGGDHEAARRLLERTVAIERQLGRAWSVAHDLAALAQMAAGRGDRWRARHLAEESRVLRAELEASDRAG